MARRRLGVVVLLDPPLADEIDGLRRALGDRALRRISPHVTLISPVNVRGEDLSVVLAMLRDAAGIAPGPLDLELGPPTTFLPVNPVLHLAVGGAGISALAAMRHRLLTGPLARPPAWPWVPHVTLVDDADETRISTAASVLADYRVDVTVDRLVVLEERVSPTGRRWEPVADAALGPRAVVGRGGLELELTVGRVIDPEAGLLLGGAGPVEALGHLPVVCTARREGRVVGVGAAWSGHEGPVHGIVVEASSRGQGIGRHLRGRIASVLADSGRELPARWTPGAGYSKTDE